MLIFFLSNFHYVFSYFYYVFILYFYYVFLLYSHLVFCYVFLLLCFHLVFFLRVWLCFRFAFLLSVSCKSFRIYYFIAFYFCGPKARVHFGSVKAHYLLSCRTLHNLPRQAQRSPKLDRPQGLPTRPVPWASPTRGPLHSLAAWHALSRMVLLLSRICPRFQHGSFKAMHLHVVFIQATHEPA